jgi:hypothetical protein
MGVRLSGFCEETRREKRRKSCWSLRICEETLMQMEKKSLGKMCVENRREKSRCS